MDLEAMLTDKGGFKKKAMESKAYLKLFEREVELGSNGRLSIFFDAVLKTNNKGTLCTIFMQESENKGFHTLMKMLSKFQSNILMTPIVRKGLRVLQHLEKQEVVQGKCLHACTRGLCMHMVSKLLFDLTKHRDFQVRALASAFQKMRFEMPREGHSSHVTICKEAWEKALRKHRQEQEGLEEGEIAVDDE